MEILKLSYLGNDLMHWLIAAGTLLLTAFSLRIIRKVLIRHLEAIAGKTTTILDDLALDVLKSTKPLFTLLLAVYAGAVMLKLPEQGDRILAKGALLVVLFQSSIWGTAAIDFWLENHLRKKASTDLAMATTYGLLSFLARIAFYSLIFLLALNNLGFDITALVAGLGIGGVAIALAVQNILGDLFSSLTIVLDKPFIVGDFVVVGDFMGTIEHIGLKTTRLRSLSGEQLIFSNTDLLQSRIRNFKRMQERRVVFSFRVIYQTRHEQLRKIPQLVRDVIESQSRIRFDRCHFKSYGASSLDFEAVYWVSDPDFNVYMDIQQAINLEIFRQFEEAGIEFAYPTQTLYVQQLNGSAQPNPGLSIREHGDRGEVVSGVHPA